MLPEAGGDEIAQAAIIQSGNNKSAKKNSTFQAKAF